MEQEEGEGGGTEGEESFSAGTASFELFKVNFIHELLQEVHTLCKHPELLRSSVWGRGGVGGGVCGVVGGRGGLVPVWEAGVLMPGGKESPSTSLLADKKPELIMCNVIAPPLPPEQEGGVWRGCEGAGGGVFT